MEAAAETDGKDLIGEATMGVRYVKASSIRVGDYIMIGDRACKVITLSVSKTGKHGHAKVRFLFSDGLDGEDAMVCSTEVQVAMRPCDDGLVEAEAAM
jgi:hypothetical protein